MHKRTNQQQSTSYILYPTHTQVKYGKQQKIEIYFSYVYNKQRRRRNLKPKKKKEERPS